MTSGIDLIAITAISRRVDLSVSADVPHATVHQRFGRLVALAGGTPVFVDASAEPEALAASVQAVVLNGGVDVDPARYGAHRHPATQAPDRSRDDFELRLARAAMARGLPILGVCRGMQILNIALGGTLVQHLPERTALDHDAQARFDVPAHEVSFVQGSRILDAYGAPPARVNSLHHQAVDRLGTGLRAVAFAPDGVVEAIESWYGPWFGVQWHPEFLSDRHAAGHVSLFRLLRRLDGVGAEHP